VSCSARAERHWSNPSICFYGFYVKCGLQHLFHYHSTGFYTVINSVMRNSVCSFCVKNWRYFFWRGRWTSKTSHRYLWSCVCVKTQVSFQQKHRRHPNICSTLYVSHGATEANRLIKYRGNEKGASMHTRHKNVTKWWSLWWHTAWRRGMMLHRSEYVGKSHYGPVALTAAVYIIGFFPRICRNACFHAGGGDSVSAISANLVSSSRDYLFSYSGCDGRLCAAFPAGRQ